MLKKLSSTFRYLVSSNQDCQVDDAVKAAFGLGHMRAVAIVEGQNGLRSLSVNISCILDSN